MFNNSIKNQIISGLLTAYPNVLFVSVNMSAKEMQLHYLKHVVTTETGQLSISDNEMKIFTGMLGMKRIEKIHIFITDKIVTFYGDGKKVNL